MKKIIASSMLLIYSVIVYCQHTQTAELIIQEDYLALSKNQKGAAWLLVIGGTTAIGITALSAATSVCFGSNCTRSVSEVPAYVGGVMILGSLPLFLAAGKNKRKALDIYTHIKMEKTQLVQQNEMNYRSVPAISVSLNW